MRRLFVPLFTAALLAAGLSACGSDDTDPGPAECTPEAGQCPNICEPGTGVEGESCSGPGDCACGLFCKDSACTPYEGANAGCSCDADTPDPDVEGDTPGDAPGPGPDVDINDCGKAAPSGAPCNPYCNLGCAAGQHCVTTDGTFSCQGSGSAAIDAECASAADCAEGLSCFSIESDPGLKCRQPCVDAGDCPEGRQCNLTVNFASGGLDICNAPTTACDLFAAESGCAEGEACVWYQSALTCREPGNLDAGQVCFGLGSAPCKEGLHCVVECVELCSTGGESPSCGDCPGASFELNPDAKVGRCIDDTPPGECDLFAQDCGGSESCYYIPGGTVCLAPGSAAAGGACSTANDCAEGTVCAGDTCRQVCSTADGADPAVACADLCPDSTANLVPPEWNIGICQ